MIPSQSGPPEAGPKRTRQNPCLRRCICLRFDRFQCVQHRVAGIICGFDKQFASGRRRSYQMLGVSTFTIKTSS